MNPATIVRRGAARFRWTVYQIGVRARRAALDARWRPSRQSTVVSVEGRLSGGTTAYRVDDPAAIEPEHGYAIHGRLGLIEQSLPYADMVRSRHERQYFSGVPSLGKLANRPPAVTVRGTAISLGHPFANNYFHAVTEIFGSLAAANELGLLDGNTAIVPSAVEASAVWREFIAATDVRIEYEVRGEHWITGESGVVYFVPARSRQDFERTLDLLSTALPPRASGADTDVRLFVGRPPTVGRALRNQGALQAALEERSFRSVDPGSLSWTEQVELFRRARLIVAVHGAALTNVIYRSPEPLALIEIRSPVMNADMYESMAAELGFDYEAVTGLSAHGGGNMASFEVDVDQVLAVVSHLENRIGSE